jgi:hypothetical protein
VAAFFAWYSTGIRQGHCEDPSSRWILEVVDRQVLSTMWKRQVVQAEWERHSKASLQC